MVYYFEYNIIGVYIFPTYNKKRVLVGWSVCLQCLYIYLICSFSINNAELYSKCYVLFLCP